MRKSKYLIFVFIAIVIASVFVHVIFNENRIENVNFADSIDSKILDSTSTRVEPFQDRVISIVIGGDVMFDRNIRARAEKNGYDYFLNPLKEFFGGADLSVVNLEGPITSNLSKTFLADGTYSKQLVFTFATITAKVLAGSGVRVVSLANNHLDNFGHAGFNETKRWLSANEVKYFGDPWNSSSTEAVFEIDGVKIALVGYHYFIGGLDRVLSDVKRLHNDGYFVIVMPHWGEEYQTKHLPIMEEIAYKFVDAGADAIIGSHPHVIMDHENIGEVPVFYSLGNLLFDQYFSADTMKGNIVRINLRKIGFGAEIKSIDIFNVYNSPKNPLRLETVK